MKTKKPLNQSPLAGQRAMESAAVPLDTELAAELREDFDYCDANRDGYLQYVEFKALLDNLDAGMSEPESHIGFKEIDTDRDDLIDFPEFMRWWTDR